MNWIEVGRVEEIPKLGARTIHTQAGNIAIFRTMEDEIFALHDRCPHKGGPLSQGIVYDRRVTCPLHNWVISLETGEATGPDTGCTNHYPVKVKNNLIYILLDKPGSEKISPKAIMDIEVQ